MMDLTFSLPEIRAAYLAGAIPKDIIDEARRRIALSEGNPIWIYQLSEAELAPYIARLEGQTPAELPLYGVPFAIKDNIDLAGVPTTAACPAFSYTPEASSVVVQALIDAGAIPMGKTNLDQLATGLVGTRSPYGAVQNSFDSSLISGGSSSGSAVSVALGQVAFSLGTDTAGSGRVPAALNNLVGYKPSCGLLSTTGVVPACKTLDCVSIFTLTVADAAAVADVVDDFDEADSYARTDRDYLADKLEILGLPQSDQLAFFGNSEFERLFTEACDSLAETQSTISVDIQPLLDAAKLLYEGAWVAERYHAAQSLIENQPDDLRPEFLKVVGGAKALTAVDYFDGEYRLAKYKRIAEQLFETIDVLVLPTVGSHFSLAEVEAEPIARNSDNGYYTNFVNLLDLAAVSIPAGFTDKGLPFGITLIGEAMTDRELLSLGRKLLGQTPRPMGATGVTMTEPLIPPTMTDTMPVAVCGAHLSGMPLNPQLLERGATLREATTSAACYKLYALPGGPPKRPGMIRTDDGVAIEVEVWEVPMAHVGSFLTGIPQPLGLGKVELASGEWVTGFICEPCGIEGAEDVSSFGGWRGYIASLS